MTDAEKIVKDGEIPSEWEAGAEEVHNSVRNAFVALDALVDKKKRPNQETKLVPAVRYKRDKDGVVIMDEDTGNPQTYVLKDEKGNTVMEDHPLIHRAKNHGFHAYRYELCEDGSVVALWANDKKGTVKLMAFDNLEDASYWSPRDER